MSIFEKVTRKVRQHLMGLELKAYSTIRSMFRDRIGLEIGGPSNIFRSDNILPIYSDAQRIDGVNFSNFTVWENKIDEGLTYNYNGKQKGFQFILEASNLNGIKGDTYDFLLSSHSLEHCANVIKTLNEWKRVLKPGGLLVLVLPDKNYTFDHQRDITNFSHLIDDYQRDINEDDLTHLEEIINCHDLNRDPGVSDMDYFRKRSLENFENRCLHHHVFDTKLVEEIFTHLGMSVLFTDLKKPYHIITIAQKH